MDSKKVVDKRSVKLEHVMASNFIPFLGGRPARDTVINDEDVMNLRITLGTIDSVEEFLAKA